MRLLGFEITRRAKAPPQSKAMSRPGGWSGWTTIFESFAGAWQQDVRVDRETLLTFSPVFACVNAIASDVAKLPIQLTQRTGNVWQPAAQNLDVLRRPNSLQTRSQFYRQWMESKLLHGNTYALIERGSRGQVVELRVLDPHRVDPLVSEMGDVFYRLSGSHDPFVSDPRAHAVIVPQREIIHDRGPTYSHPLIGLSPIRACNFAASQGVHIQKNSAKLFSNMSRPAGILTADGAISDETAKRIKSQWESGYSGDNYGKTAVLADGLKYQPIAVTPKDAELVEQLRWSAEDVCRAFGVPAARVGVVPAASGLTYQNISALIEGYYRDTLQQHLESIEELLDNALGLPPHQRTEFDTSELLRMDPEAEQRMLTGYVSSNIMDADEARARIGLPPREEGR